MNNLDPQANPSNRLNPPSLSLKSSDISNVTADLPPKVDSKIKQRAEEVLYKENAGRPYVSTSLKHFANIQASTILRGSGMEGASTPEALEYWLNLLNKWEKNEAQVVNPGLSPKEIQAVRNSLQDCLDFIEIFKTKDPHKAAALLKSKLEQRRECYLPLGWKGVPGHFMIAKVRDNSKTLSMELLTKGGGGEFHDKIDQGGKKNKINYKSDPVSVDKGLLVNSKVGRSFFNRLMEMQDPIVKYSETAKDLNGTDLYGLFNLMDETPPNKPQSTTPTRIIGVTPQRAGTCTDTGLRMTLYETIFDTDPTRTSKDLKRSMFAFKTQSLVDGFRQFHGQIERGDPQTCLYFRHAVQEHFTRLSKLYPELITSDELALGLALGKEIDDKLKIAEEIIKAKSQTPAMPKLGKTEALTQNADTLPSVDKL